MKEKELSLWVFFAKPERFLKSNRFESWILLFGTFAKETNKFDFVSFQFEGRYFIFYKLRLFEKILFGGALRRQTKNYFSVGCAKRNPLRNKMEQGLMTKEKFKSFLLIFLIVMAGGYLFYTYLPVLIAGTMGLLPLILLIFIAVIIIFFLIKVVKKLLR